MLRYHSVAPSSEIYLSNHDNHVNKQREATMIGFDLLCDLKEVESVEHINQPIHINNITLKRHASHSDILSLGPADVLNILGLTHPHDIGNRSSKNTN